MFSNNSSPIMIISGEAAKKAFHEPKKLTVDREKAIKKARKDLKKAGLII